MTDCKHGRRRTCEFCAVEEERDEARADNARLRALVRQAEWWTGDAECCGWCGAYYHSIHADDCPAFTPDGTVR